MNAYRRDLSWVAPFACIGAAVLALLRPLPSFPPPAHSRIVVDAKGAEVAIPDPFPGVIPLYGWWGAGAYLETTHAPETLQKAGSASDRVAFAKGLMSLIYPHISTTDSYWDRKGKDVESILAADRGAVYLGAGGDFGPIPALRRAGLPALEVHRSSDSYPGEALFTAARTEGAVIGQPERAEADIADYRQAFADGDHDLQAETLAHRPRVLWMSSSTRDRSWLRVMGVNIVSRTYCLHAGVDNAAEGHLGEGQDAERILAMDPDIIFLGKPSPKDFMDDSRWRGLRAVGNRRVYRGPPHYPTFDGWGFARNPADARWMAEIAHPDRLPPRTRRMLREHFDREFDYRLSDEQIDTLLHVDENQEQRGYERFTRAYGASPIDDSAP